ncbi:MAG: NFACT family protein, partial [Sulfurimonas sp.]
MKLSHLKQLLPYFLNFKKIFAIYRVADTTIKVSFDKNDHIFFDMKKGDSKIFKAQNLLQSKVYNAPFDVILTKRLNNSHIKDIELVNGDKVLRFKCLSSSSYKELTSYLQFEFTGKHTNVIILDENLVVLEALRHIDKFSSFREVRVGKKLLDIPKANFVAKEYPL